jgi:hypothetical protein
MDSETDMCLCEATTRVHSGRVLHLTKIRVDAVLRLGWLRWNRHGRIRHAPALHSVTGKFNFRLMLFFNARVLLPGRGQLVFGLRTARRVNRVRRGCLAVFFSFPAEETTGRLEPRPRPCHGLVQARA